MSIKQGSHQTPEDGMCIMEYVSYAYNEPFSDKPTCVHPALAGAARAANDLMTTDEARHKLLELVPRMAQTGTLTVPQAKLDEFVHCYISNPENGLIGFDGDMNDANYRYVEAVLTFVETYGV